MLLGGPAGAELHADVDSRLNAAGAWIYRGKLPMECDERYIRLYFNNTASGGAFAIDAWLEAGPPTDANTEVLKSNVGNP
jgi:hypothetical protein